MRVGVHVHAHVRSHVCVCLRARSGVYCGSLTATFEDFAVFAAAWLSQDSYCDISAPPDGFVDWLDLEVFVNNWLTDREQSY